MAVSDFEGCLKQNLESLLIMLINGLALFILYKYELYAVQAQKGLIYIVLRYIVIMIGIIYCMMNMFIFPMLVTYKPKLRQYLRMLSYFNG